MDTLPGFEPYTLMFLGGALGALMVIVPLFISAYVFLQRFATKDELRASEERTAAALKISETRQDEMERRITSSVVGNRDNNEHRFGELAGKLDSLNNSVQLFTNETSRSTGALEGKLSIIERLTTLNGGTPASAD